MATTQSKSSSPTASEWAKNKENNNGEDDDGPPGCYLVYESSSGGVLSLHYSLGPVPEHAVGFWCPGAGQQIQPFKFKQNSGRSELIKGIAGGDANRRKYFSGWCQFLKQAVAKRGLVIQFTPAQQGVPVDVYGYKKDKQEPTQLDLESGLVDVSQFDAVAVMPKGHEFMKGVKTMLQATFLEKGNIAGASTLIM